jgi:O-antigen/teichoic acid export membrane protein
VSAQPIPQQESLTRVAQRGSLWMSAQALANKFASALSMLLIARALTPAELGLGQLTVSIVNFMTVIPPIVMCDVLVANQQRLAEIARRGARIAGWTGFLTALVLAAASPFVSRAFPKYPATELALLITALGLRAFANALGTAPAALLRSELRYRTIVAIDGSVQLGSTLLTLVLAISGAGASAIVAPYLIGSAVRSSVYAWAARELRKRSMGTAESPRGTGALPPIGRQFLVGSLAQYVHTAVVALPMLALGAFSDDQETGLFGFAMLLAVQTTTVISFQLGVILQPVFGRLGHDPTRQIAAYAKALRTLGFVSVPLSVLQAAFAEPLFALLFSPKWDGSLRSFQILSVAQCFQFALAPTLSVIKAQARFRTTFLWQMTHFAIGAVLAAFAAQRGSTAMALTVTALWGASVPCATWLAGRPAKLPLTECVRLFLAPWSIALPIGFAGLALSAWATPFGAPAQLGALVGGGGLLGMTAIVATSWLYPQIFAAITEIGPMRRVIRYIPLLRRAPEAANR